MKKKIVLLVILVIGFAAGNALAYNLLNPGFELGDLGRFGGPPIPGWTTFGTNGWHHSDPNAFRGTKAVKIWFNDTYIYQDFPVVAGKMYDFSVWAIALKSDNLGLYGRDGFFQVKWYDEGNTLILAEVIGYFYADPCAIPYHAPDPYDIWKFISGTRTVPSLAVTCRVFMGMTVGGIPIPFQRGSVNWDDVSVTWRYAASNPEPADGALDLVPFEVTALSWTRPAPRQGGDIIRCDVWFGTDPCMPGTNTKILNKQDANSVAISSLASNQDYYWRVDCYDPNSPGPEIKSEGDETWTFNTAGNCGPSYMPGDINGDCYVNFADVEEMAANWLKCNDVSNPQCQ